MDQMPLLAVIFQGIPESLVVFSFGMAIVGEFLNWKKILICSLIVPFSMMFIRATVPVFGLHTIISAIIIFILFWKIIKLDIKKAIFSTLSSILILLLLEVFIAPIFFNLFNTSYPMAYQNTIERILFSYPGLIIYAIITYLVYYFKLSIFKGSRDILNE